MWWIANTWFSFLKDSPAQVETVLGDARIQLAAKLDARRRRISTRIAVDAFSSDSIPMHLLTGECADLYRRHLKPDGVLLLHITNKTLDLEPVARGIAEHLGWQAAELNSASNPATGENTSQWVLLTSANLSRFPASAGWKPLTRPPLQWTDDFASLWHVLKL